MSSPPNPRQYLWNFSAVCLNAPNIAKRDTAGECLQAEGTRLRLIRATSGMSVNQPCNPNENVVIVKSKLWSDM